MHLISEHASTAEVLVGHRKYINSLSVSVNVVMYSNTERTNYMLIAVCVTAAGGSLSPQSCHELFFPLAPFSSSRLLLF